VGTTELVHEVGDDSVEVNSVIEARVGQIDEVAASDGHLIGEELGLEGAHTGLKSSDGHG